MTGVGQLEVPMASLWALHKALVPARRDEYALGDDEHVRAIAAPVVAAELRQQAAEARRLRVTPRQCPRARAVLEQMSLLLDARADELDGGSRG